MLLLMMLSKLKIIAELGINAEKEPLFYFPILSATNAFITCSTQISSFYSDPYLNPVSKFTLLSWLNQKYAQGLMDPLAIKQDILKGI